MSYRFKNSSAWTGRFPRSTEQRWLSHPVSFREGWFRRLLIWVCGF